MTNSVAEPRLSENHIAQRETDVPTIDTITLDELAVMDGMKSKVSEVDVAIRMAERYGQVMTVGEAIRFCKLEEQFNKSILAPLRAKATEKILSRLNSDAGLCKYIADAMVGDDNRGTRFSFVFEGGRIKWTSGSVWAEKTDDKKQDSHNGLAPAPKQRRG